LKIDPADRLDPLEGLGQSGGPDGEIHGDSR
jgi:hypothetical protein